MGALPSCWCPSCYGRPGGGSEVGKPTLSEHPPGRRWPVAAEVSTTHKPRTDTGRLEGRARSFTGADLTRAEGPTPRDGARKGRGGRRATAGPRPVVRRRECLDCRTSPLCLCLCICLSRSVWRCVSPTVYCVTPAVPLEGPPPLYSKLLIHTPS